MKSFSKGHGRVLVKVNKQKAGRLEMDMADYKVNLAFWCAI